MPFNFEHIVNTKEYKESKSILHAAHQAVIEKYTADLACDSSTHPDTTTGGTCSLEEEEKFENGPNFFPPVYIQRYRFVAEILTDYGIEKVVDFGSAECKIVTLLKSVPSLREVALVDIDKSLLENSAHRIRPLAADFLFERKQALDVYSYCGDVTKLDERIVGYDGVSMVEIIEHLEKDVLDAAIKMVFSELHPKLVVMTTPNSDFNVLFPELKGFRHWDHKFEWSRKEFQTWCEHLASVYGYTVHFDGVGESGDRRDVGCCSQCAVFNRDIQRTVLVKATQHYELVLKSTFPRIVKIIEDRDECLMNEVLYNINCFRPPRRYTDDDVINVSIAELLRCRKIKEMECTFSELSGLLSKNGYSLTEDKKSVIISLENDSSDSNLTVSEDEESQDRVSETNNGELYFVSTNEKESVLWDCD